MTTQANTIQTIAVTKRDGSTKSVESPYTNSEVVAKLHDYCFDMAIGAPLNRNGFAVSLANTSVRCGGLSPKQIAWAHVIVIEHESRQQQRTQQPAQEAVSLEQIRAMMDEAAESLQNPKINLRTASGARVKLHRAGRASRVPGTIYVTDGRGFNNNTYYGKIALDGRFTPARGCNEEVTALLVNFDRDPQATATAHGHNTGSCCFCNRSLSDGRSVAMGYGPICADKFHLPWGEERASSTVEVSAEDVAPAVTPLPELDHFFTI